MGDGTQNATQKHGKYVLVNALSLRIKALHGGDKPLVARPVNDLAAIATEEMKQRKLRIEQTKEPVLPSEEETPAE